MRRRLRCWRAETGGVNTLALLLAAVLLVAMQVMGVTLIADPHHPRQRRAVAHRPLRSPARTRHGPRGGDRGARDVRQLLPRHGLRRHHRPGRHGVFAVAWLLSTGTGARSAHHRRPDDHRGSTPEADHPYLGRWCNSWPSPASTVDCPRANQPNTPARLSQNTMRPTKAIRRKVQTRSAGISTGSGLAGSTA